MKNTDINQIAKQTRETLKKEFPNCKFSVTLEKYSGGRSMTIALMSANFEALRDEGHTQLNHYALMDGFERHSGTQIIRGEWTVIPNGYGVCSGSLLSEKAWEVMRRAVEIGNAENWDNSDSQSDYFDVNYYLHVNIGKWDRNFVNTAKVEQPAEVINNLSRVYLMEA
jgi:hypothetical protein